MNKTVYREINAKDIEYNLIHLSNLVFEVTDACNLRCKYCGYADLYEGYDERENLNFPFIRAKRVIDYLYAFWENNYINSSIEPITISFYGGEPLLNVRFIKKVIEYINQLPFVGKRFSYNMTTNAMLLDKYMDFLYEQDFKLLISLDGDEKGHSYRIDTAGNNSFKRVYKNIKLLQKKYPLYYDRKVMFNSVLHNRNNVEDIYNFIQENFNKSPFIAPLNNSGIRPDKIDDFKRTYRNYYESINQASNCENLKSKLFIKAPETDAALKYLYYQSGNVFFNYNDLLFKNQNSFILPTGTCIPFAKKMFVTVKGRILQCEKINHEFSLGKVTDSGVELDFNHIANQYNDYVFKYIEQCEICGNRKSCTQCVYQIDNIHSANTKCHSFCTEQEKEKRNQCILKYISETPNLYKRLLEEVVIRA